MTTPSGIARCGRAAPPIVERLRFYFERAAGGGPSESAAARASRSRAADRTDCARAALTKTFRAAGGNGSVTLRSIRLDDAPPARPKKNLARLHIPIHSLRKTVNMHH
ncbi:hypothetical protein [Burkholderia humptydooensis]|uniref:hypothetical protein n=1 Tax=Burkholderia humptydooensis TaxID=430531 RepID=UPI000A9BB074|nr:hypothetical protein [Burkholderia humptydooensis]